MGLSGRSPRDQHGAEGMFYPHHQGGGRRDRARGPWKLVRTGFTPGQENEFMIKWLKGEHIKIKV